MIKQNQMKDLLLSFHLVCGTSHKSILKPQKIHVQKFIRMQPPASFSCRAHRMLPSSFTSSPITVKRYETLHYHPNRPLILFWSLQVVIGPTLRVRVAPCLTERHPTIRSCFRHPTIRSRFLRLLRTQATRQRHPAIRSLFLRLRTQAT